MTARGVELAANRQCHHHDDETELKRGEVAEALGKFPALPGQDCIHGPIQRCQHEVGFVAKAELCLHEEVDVVEIEDR